MIRFIDLTTGNVFNGDKPYVFWFDKEQSVNLQYIRKICVVTSLPSLHISLPSNPVFSLLDTDAMGEDLEENGFKFKDLGHEGFKCNELDLVGVPYRDVYVYMLYILGNSAEAGEFHEDITLSGVYPDSETETQTFEIGADFYNESENLSIELGNKGFEIPKAVQKAIYETNIHEEGTDNILLNRKYKELLSEYINIIGNKGSYKSLINSLKWFEYGDLVKILEHWSYNVPAKGEYLSQYDLQSVVNKDIENILSKQHKTTFIGLYLALQQISRDDNGDISYRSGVQYFEDEADKSKYGEEWTSARTQKLLTDEGEVIMTDPKDRLLQIGEDQIKVEDYPVPFIDRTDPSKRGSNWVLLERWYDDHGNVVTREIPEPVPDLIMTASKWSAIDLSLKMTLLGNFYKTYFMPIHLDLIHSTIENIVFTNTHKIFSWGSLQRDDYNFDTESFDCSVQDGDVFYITDNKARVYPDTTFSTQYFDINPHNDPEGETQLDIFGVDTEDRYGDVGSITFSGISQPRNVTLDTIASETRYFAWGDIFTKNPEPQVGEFTYRFGEGSNNPTEGPTISQLGITAIYNLERDRLERTPGNDFILDGVNYLCWGETFYTTAYSRHSTIYSYSDNILTPVSEISSVEYTQIYITEGGETQAFVRDAAKDKFIPSYVVYGWGEGYFTDKPTPEIGSSVLQTNDEGVFVDCGVVDDVTYENGWAPSTTGEDDKGYQRTFNAQRFEGPAAVVPFDLVLHRTQSKMQIVEGTILCYHNDETTLHKSFNIHNDPGEVVLGGDRHIHFNILLQDTGDYKFVIDMKCGNGRHYMKTVNFTISDNTHQTTKMYRVCRRQYDDILKMLTEEPVPGKDLLNNMFSQLEKSDVLYKQFLVGSDTALLQKIGLNEFFIYEPKVRFVGENPVCDYDFTFDQESTGIRLDTPSEYVGIKLNSATEGSLQAAVNELNRIIRTHSKACQKHFFVQNRVSLRVDKIINDFESDPRFSENIAIYNYKKDLGQLYSILLNLTENDSPNTDYYVTIPYVIGIDPQFLITDDKEVIVDHLNVGVVRDDIHYQAHLRVYMDMFSHEVSIGIVPKTRNNFKRLSFKYLKESGELGRLKYDSDWKDMNLPKPGKPAVPIKNDRCIINDQLYLRVWFSNDFYKDVVIDIPKWFAEKSKQVESKEFGIVTVYGRSLAESSNVLNRMRNWKCRAACGKFWDEYRFVPLFHRLEEVPSRKVEWNDVVCFLPDLDKIKASSIQDIRVGWTFKNATTGEVIEPAIWSPKGSDQLIVPLEPALGRFDVRKLIDPGYYDVTLKYELTDNCYRIHKSETKSSCVICKK